MRILTLAILLTFGVLLYAQDVNQEINHSKTFDKKSSIPKVFEIEGQLYGYVHDFYPDAMTFYKYDKKLKVLKERTLSDNQGVEELLSIIIFKNKVYVKCKIDNGKNKKNSYHLKRLNLNNFSLNENKISFRRKTYPRYIASSEDRNYHAFMFYDESGLTVYDSDFNEVSDHDDISSHFTKPRDKFTLQRNATWQLSNNGDVFALYGNSITSYFTNDFVGKYSYEYYILKFGKEDVQKSKMLNIPETPELLEGEIMILNNGDIAMVAVASKVKEKQSQGVFAAILSSDDLSIVDRTFNQLDNSFLTHKSEKVKRQPKIDDLSQCKTEQIQKTSEGYFYMVYTVHKELAKEEFAEETGRTYVSKFLDNGTLEWTKYIRNNQRAWSRLVGVYTYVDIDGNLQIFYNTDDDIYFETNDIDPEYPHRGHPYPSMVVKHTVKEDGKMSKDNFKNIQLELDNKGKSETHLEPRYCYEVINHADLLVFSMTFARRTNDLYRVLSLIRTD